MGVGLLRIWDLGAMLLLRGARLWEMSVARRESPSCILPACLSRNSAWSSDRRWLRIAGKDCATGNTQATVKRGNKANGLRTYWGEKGSETEEQRRTSKKPWEASGLDKEAQRVSWMGLLSTQWRRTPKIRGSQKVLTLYNCVKCYGFQIYLPGGFQGEEHAPSDKAQTPEPAPVPRSFTGTHRIP